MGAPVSDVREGDRARSAKRRVSTWTTEARALTAPAPVPYTRAGP